MPTPKRQSRAAAPALVVHQLTLATLQTARSRLRQLRDETRRLEAQETALETEAVALLQAGAQIEAGPLTACVELKTGACRPSWKDLHLAHMAEHGVAAALVEEGARALYPAKVTPALVIDVRPGAGVGRA